MNSVSGENKLHKLALSGRSYSIAKGQIIQSSDDRYRSLINIVKSGYVKRYEILADGSLSIQAVYGPMEVFPLTLAFRELANTEVYEGPEIIHYQAITNVELVSIDASKLTEAVNNDPTIYKDVLRETGIRTHSNIQRLENLSLKSSYKRLAHQLVYLARRFGEPTPNGIKIRVQLTHQLDQRNCIGKHFETI